jgi:hypothetical protein
MGRVSDFYPRTRDVVYLQSTVRDGKYIQISHLVRVSVLGLEEATEEVSSV